MSVVQFDREAVSKEKVPTRPGSKWASGRRRVGSRKAERKAERKGFARGARTR